MRLEITRRSDLALRLLRVLERASGPLRAADLAEIVDSTAQYIPQVMSPLVRAGWVVSEPGPRGGYSLMGSLEDTSVLRLIELMEGRTDSDACVLRGGPCAGAERCALHDAWAIARTVLLERLARVPISKPAIHDTAEENHGQ